jgi:phenylalanyl-tRNA synthetase alpha chain
MSIPNHIKNKLNRNLFLKEDHPICIIKEKIYDYFGDSFLKKDDFYKVANVKNNFDDLLIKEDHPSRSKNDTYYVSKNEVLRTHMTAHLTSILSEYSDNGFKNFLYTGDVYRKDEIDSSHFPVFHQMDGVCLMDSGSDPVNALKTSLGGLIEHLFPGCEYSFKDEYYPFNSTAFEVNVNFNGKLIEVLGCGVKRQEILDSFGLTNKVAWGFGLGLDRLAMIFFEIPDIRYIWSDDVRFLKQFKKGKITKFKPYSKYPPVYKDVSFFIDKDFNLNQFYEICREEAGDLIENIFIMDNFFSDKEKKESICFRITYRSNDKNLTDVEINEIHNKIKEQIKNNPQLKLR